MAAIFKATYSGVPVYEINVNNVAVMRRRSDDWFNATQILKVAGFDKPQRTRVLEREVQKDVHEKVQGGYGKYQGTWIPMEKAQQLSSQYGVDILLKGIFDFVPSHDSPPPAPKANGSASASRTKRSTKSSPPHSQQQNHVQQQQLHVSSSNNTPQYAGQSDLFQHQNLNASSRLSQAFSQPESSDIYHHHHPPSASDDRSATPDHSENTASSGTPSPVANDANDANEDPDKGPSKYARMILDYFVAESSQIPSFLLSPPANFDPNVIIDDDGHTALHWACAMGRIRIVKLLLSAGADIFRANAMGQTALMRSVMFTNNYDLRRFPALFELLHRSTINIDRLDRTVFHYAVDIALQKGKVHAARYYIETIVSRLCEYPTELADILNYPDHEGETALTLAARARSKRLVRVLLQFGANPKIRNHEGKSAEDYILEDERFRASSTGPTFQVTNTNNATTGTLTTPMVVGSALQQSSSATNSSGGGGGGLLNTNTTPTGSTQQAPSGLTAGASQQQPNSTSASAALARGLEGPAGITPSSSGAVASLIAPMLYSHEPVLRMSETAQRTSSTAIPQVAELLESLASSFDSELAAKERDLAHARSLVANIEAEGRESKRMKRDLSEQVAELKPTLDLEKKLMKAYEAKMEKRYQEGWEKFVKDENDLHEELVKKLDGASNDQQEKELTKMFNLSIDPDVLKAECESLREEISKRRSMRSQLFETLVELKGQSGTGAKMADYRRLIALGCNISPDDVDSVIPALAEALEMEEQSVNANAALASTSTSASSIAPTIQS